MNISEIIQKILDEYNITQADIAKILNVDSSTISRAVNGRFNMKAESLCLLSYYFNIPLEVVLNYDALVAPHEKLKAQIIEEKGAYCFTKEEEIKSVLSFAEELENQNISYTKLLRDASFEEAKITADAGDKFKSGDSVFYRKEKLARNGYVLYSPSPNFLEVRYLVQTGREGNLHHPNDFDDVIRYSFSLNTSGRILGYIYYLVRNFENRN